MKFYRMMNEKEYFDFTRDVKELMPIALVQPKGYQRWMRATMPYAEARFGITVNIYGEMESELYNLLTKKWGFVEVKDL